MYFVYILRSYKDGGYYIGCSGDVKKRIREHNSGKTSSLKNRRPLGLVYLEKFDNVATAFAREKQIKKYKSGEAFRKLIGGVA